MDVSSNSLIGFWNSVISMEKKLLYAIIIGVIAVVAVSAAAVVISSDDDHDDNNGGDSTLAVSVSDLNDAKLKIFGNADGDGDIDQDDVDAIQKLIDDSGYLAMADADGDGDIDEDDLNIIKAVVDWKDGDAQVSLLNVNYHDTDGNGTMDTELVSTKFPVTSAIMTASSNDALLVYMLDKTDIIHGASYSYSAKSAYASMDITLFGDNLLDTSKVAKIGSSSTSIPIEDGTTSSGTAYTGSSKIIKDYGVTAVITDWNRTYITNESEYEKTGVDVIRVAAASLDKDVYTNSILTLGFFTQSLSKAAEVVSAYDAAFESIDSKVSGISDSDKVSAVASSMSGYISSGGSDYTDVIVRAGAKFALEGYDFGSSASVKPSPDHLDIYQNYSFDYIVHLRTVAGYATSTDDGLSYAQSVYKTYSDSFNLWENYGISGSQILVSGCVPVPVRVALTAYALYGSSDYSDIFTLTWANEISQSFINLFSGDAANLTAGELTLVINSSDDTYSTITYNMNGYTNSPLNPTKYREGAKVTLSDPILSDDKHFDGWYTDSEFTTKFGGITADTTGDIVIYAKVVDGFTVTFDAQNGASDAVTKVSYADGSTVNVPLYKHGSSSYVDVPEYSGHTFLGWYTDSGEKYSFTTAETESFTLTAKWQVTEAANIYLKVLGNANKDLTIDVDDVAIINDIIAGTKTYDDYPYADANNDGKVDSTDLDLVNAMIAKTDGTTVYVDNLDRTGARTMTQITYPLDNIVFYGTNIIYPAMYVGAADHTAGYFGKLSYANSESALPSSGAKQLGTAARSITPADWKQFTTLASEKTIGAFVVDFSGISAITNTFQSDLDKGGIPMLSWGSADVSADAYSALTLAFLFGGDNAEIGEKYAQKTIDVIDAIAQKVSTMSDSEKQSYISLNMYIYICENDSTFNTSATTAGGVPYYTINKNFASKYAGKNSTKMDSTEALSNYTDVDKLINNRSIDFGTDVNDTIVSTWTHSNNGVSSEKYFSKYLEKLYYVNNLLPAGAKVAYMAYALYGDTLSGDSDSSTVFSKEWADSTLQYFIDMHLAPFQYDSDGTTAYQTVDSIVTVFGYSDYQAAKSA